MGGQAHHRMSAFLSGVWSKVALAAAFVLGLLLLVGKLMSAGRAQEQADQAKRNDQIRRDADEVRRDVDAYSDAQLDDSVRKWTRE